MIRVRRKHIWEDSLRAFKKHSFSHQKLLRVHFIGEEAEDAGGPRREYLRLLMKELADKSGVLEGPEGHNVLTANSLLVFNKVYFYAGLMVSVSLRQGGPGMCCLSLTLYSYIANQPVHDATLHDVADYTARANIEKVCVAVNLLYLKLKYISSDLHENCSETEKHFSHLLKNQLRLQC